MERVVEKLAEDASRFSTAARPRIAGGSVGALGFSAGIQFDRGESHVPSPEARLTMICRELGEEGREALILIDELQANDSEIRRLAATYQELVGEGLNVAIVLAGVPSSVSEVLNDKVLTFLNRARKVALEALPRGEVDAFLRSGFEKCGVHVPVDHRRFIVETIQGAPYLMQLAGHYVVEYADDEGAVDNDAIEMAVKVAREEYEQDVCTTILSPLSRRDKDYLKAMALLGTPCRTSRVAEEMAVTPDYAQQYRRRLIDAGIITTSAQGEVEFAVPLLEDYLKEGR